MTPKNRPAQDRGRQRRRSTTANTVLLYGRHAVEAALANTRRVPVRLFATNDAGGPFKAAGDLRVELVPRERLDRMLPDGSPHQGLILEAKTLPVIDLKTWLEDNPRASRLVVLDQVSDPRNLGAILRSAAAFEVDAVIVPERHSAELNGACARAAAGALDIVPVIQAGNLARALATIKEHGFWTVGLDAAATALPGDLPAIEKSCLILGAEEKGLRRLTREHCDHLVRLPIAPAIESLNVAVAAGIALYALAGTRPEIAPDALEQPVDLAGDIDE